MCALVTAVSLLERTHLPAHIGRYVTSIDLCGGARRACTAGPTHTMNNAIEMLIEHTEPRSMKERKSTFMSDTVGAAAAE